MKKLSINETEILFSAVDKKRHEYTWDYSSWEEAIAVLDVNGDYFAMISKRRDIADETGAMLDYRDNTYYIWYLYSKSDLRKVEKLSGTISIQSFDWSEGRPKDVGKDNLIDRTRKEPWGSDIKEVESILLDSGRVSILNGNLMLDRFQE